MATFGVGPAVPRPSLNGDRSGRRGRRRGEAGAAGGEHEEDEKRARRRQHGKGFRAGRWVNVDALYIGRRSSLATGAKLHPCVNARSSRTPGTRRGTTIAIRTSSRFIPISSGRNSDSLHGFFSESS